VEVLAAQPTFLKARSWRIVLGGWLLAASKAMAARSLRGHGRLNRLARRMIGDRYIEVPYLGRGSIWICPGHTMGEDVARRGVYEPQVIRAVQTFVDRGFSFVDVGANVGLHTVAAGLSRRSEKQRFFAFEPEPRSFLLLERNCRSNGLDFVETRQAAVGSREGITKLFVSTTYNQGHHSLVQHSDEVRVAACPVTTLDAVFLSGAERIEGPVLVKIDVEGTEPDVLAGGMRWLQQKSSLAVICEIFPGLLQHTGHTGSDVIGLLRGIGCDQFLITGDSSAEPWRRVNAAAINDMTEVLFNLLATKGAEASQLLEVLTV
jgi:FkbM family methyltransferase